MMSPPPISADAHAHALWLIVSIVALVTVAVGAAGYFFRQRLQAWWSGRRESARRGEPNESHFTVDRLVGIWRKFVTSQPALHRRQLLEYPTLVVLGPAGAGKSTVIDQQVDWQAQKKRFFPSATGDPLLQVYLGSRVIVQELSPALLADASPLARRALVRLWRASTRHHPPTVMVVIDGVALAAAPPEEIRRQAHLVRGKIDLLQEVCDRPARVSLCLTHMDGLVGFVELAQVCNRLQLPLSVELEPLVSSGNGQPHSPLAKHEGYLSAVLAASTAERFNRVVDFMAQSTGLGTSVSAFLAPLVERSRVAQPPALERLFFFASSEPCNDHIFQGAPPPRRTRTPVDRFVRHCAVAGAAVFALLSLAHANHAHKLSAARAALARYESLLPEARLGAAAPAEFKGALEDADRALEALAGAERWWPLLALSARAEKHALAARLVDTTRSGYLVPLLRQWTVGCREPTLYVLGVLYGARDNPLGEFVAARAQHWALRLGIPETAVTAYIHWSAHAWRGSMALGEPAQGACALFSLQQWSEFLDELQGAIDSQEMAAVAPLQARATGLYEALERGRDFSEAAGLLPWLQEQAPVDFNRLLQAPKRQEAMAWIDTNRAALEGVLAMVRAGDLRPEHLGHLTLVPFVSHLRKLTTAGPGEIWTLQLNHSYQFARLRWSELVARASIQAYVKLDGYPFLPRAVARPDAPEPSPPAGASAPAAAPGAPLRPAGAASVDVVADVYHRAFVEGSVRPELEELARALPALPLPPVDKAALAAYVLEQTKDYAAHYREALLASYQPFAIHVRGAGELPAAVTELIRPTGGFMRWLHGVADDSDLGNLDSVYLRPLGEAVASMQPIVRLVKPGKDAAPSQLNRYVAMVTTLARELAGTEKSGVQLASAGGFTPLPPPVPAAPPENGNEDDADGLSKALTPVGRTSMAMLLQPETSYLAQTNQLLQEVGIGPDLRAPFVEPFERVLDFGVPEIESALERQWTRQWAQLSPMFAKYPFVRRAHAEVDPQELDALKENGGTFWPAFRAKVGPFCAQKGGVYMARGPLLRKVELPAGMLARVNLVARLSHTYFDKSGNRAPLALMVTPLPLPRELDRQGYVTMSFLRAGGATVFGFNQQPTARTFAPAWWLSEAASIGIMFNSPGKEGHPDRSVDSSASPWALYRLIERGTFERSRAGGDETLVWTLPGDGLGEHSIPIRFVVRGDALALHPWTFAGGDL